MIKALRSKNAGAVGILIVDDTFDETPITMDESEEEGGDQDESEEEGADQGDRITIPYVLLIRSLGDKMKKALSEGQMVIVHLDWMVPPNKKRPTYEFWTTSDALPGPKFDSQMNFPAGKLHGSSNTEVVPGTAPGHSKAINALHGASTMEGTTMSVGKLVAADGNKLRVTSPKSLKGIYEVAIGKFGLPEHGGTITGTVVYPERNHKACYAFGDTDDFRMKNPHALPVFFLVDRGDCFFTIKAWRSQNAGAAAILIADDYFDEMPIMINESEEEGVDLGDGISIPYAFIRRSLGDKMKKALSEEQMVIVHLDWMVPPNKKRPTYEFWTTNDAMSGQMNILARKPHGSSSTKANNHRLVGIV